MSVHTAIQWCDDTVNPVMGCCGCELWRRETDGTFRRCSCYAGLLHRLRAAGGATPSQMIDKGYAPFFEQPHKFPGRMMTMARTASLTDMRRYDKPWLDGMPRMIFVSDMGDALSKSIDLEFLHAEIIDTATSPEGSQHIWLWLTKQPQRMAAFFAEQLGGCGWPTNVWPGTSITAQESVGRLRRVDHLRRVGDERTVRFLSVEPQLEHVSLAGNLTGIGWVIQGGESENKRTTPGTPEYDEYGARPFDLSWARSLREECRDAGVPYFLKQLGTRAHDGGEQLKLRDRHGGDWDEWPADLRVRDVPHTGGRGRAKKRLCVVSRGLS
jgi:protein gp37